MNTNPWELVLKELGIYYTKRKTGVLVSLCPFHKEKTPSCHFWPKSRNFFCHGCLMGTFKGSMLSFLKEYFPNGDIRFLERELEKILNKNLSVLLSEKTNQLLFSFTSELTPK